MTCVLTWVECWLVCVVRRMFGATVYSVVRWLFGCGLVGLLVVLIVLLYLAFLAMPGPCYFLRVTHQMNVYVPQPSKSSFCV